jgi:hypothetical protein
MVELFLHFPIPFHSVVLNSLIKPRENFPCPTLVQAGEKKNERRGTIMRCIICNVHQ